MNKAGLPGALTWVECLGEGPAPVSSDMPCFLMGGPVTRGNSDSAHGPTKMGFNRLPKC